LYQTKTSCRVLGFLMYLKKY